jgi:DNA-directed RNA polymerase subunit RPC12/RpoP
MRYFCHFCGRSVTTELPDDSVIRAVLVCPECIEDRRILIPSEPHTVSPGGTPADAEYWRRRNDQRPK